MPVPKVFVQYTPIRARTGKIVHATTLETPQETACGKKFRGWMVALERLNCPECRLAIHADCRKPKAGKRKKVA